MAREPAGLQDDETERVVGLWGLPGKLDSLNPNKEHSIGDRVGNTAIGGMQACDLAFHATPVSGPDNC